MIAVIELKIFCGHYNYKEYINGGFYGRNA